jgi:zinc/manganese transport system permease protein
MEALALLGVPLLAALLLVGIHTLLGLHVLTRRIVFVDLALAQIAALGATLAFLLGYPPQSPGAFGYSLLFTLGGAVLLTWSRAWSGARISPEAIVGVIYVVSAAAAVLLVDRAPQGAEHLKQILTGNILTVTPLDLAKLALLYAAVGVVHVVWRRPLWGLSRGAPLARGSGPVWWWDFVFYALFGLVVTSSVAVAGVLLVFSFLIMPAAIGWLYSGRADRALVIGWLAGVLASGLGLAASYAWDLPTGAAMVCMFGAVLALAALAKPLVLARAAVRRRRARRALAWTGRAALLVLAASALWLVLVPQADQPLLDALERAWPTARRPFHTAGEWEIIVSSQRAEQRAASEAARLTEKERASRWQGEALPDEEVRRLSSYTQSFLEMRRGEQVVQRALRDQARARQRWILGIPVLLASVGALLILWPAGRGVLRAAIRRRTA